MTDPTLTTMHPSWRLWLAVLVFVTLVAVAGYVKFGTPSALDARPALPASQPQVGSAPIEQMVTSLAAKLEREPNNVEGWMMLARSYLVLNRPAEALAAFEALRKYKPADPQLEAAIGELRGIVGRSDVLPSMSVPTAEVASSSAAQARRSSVAGQITLAPVLKDVLPANATLFIFAYAVDGPRMPLAVAKHKASELPLSFSLDDTAAMNPAFRLSIASQVIVGARVSASGSAKAEPGDLQGFSKAVPVGARDVQVQIGEMVRR